MLFQCLSTFNIWEIIKSIYTTYKRPNKIKDNFYLKLVLFIKQIRIYCKTI